MKRDGVEGEFTSDGEDMWNRIGDDTFINDIEEGASMLKEVSAIVRTREPKIKRQELILLINYSEKIVVDCTHLVEKYKKTEEYFKANEARVTGLIHKDYAERLKRVLSGGVAFPFVMTTEGDTIYIE